jgi:alcohol dehydrogenase
MESFPAYLIEGSADAVQARFATLEPAQLDPGDVVVRIQYASVNYKDALAATGRGRIIRRFPCVGGIDAAGTVESSDNPRFKPGDVVIVHSHGFGVSHHGGYATRARVPADWVNHIPPALSALDAITIGVAGYTAALAVDLMERNGLAPGRGLSRANRHRRSTSRSSGPVPCWPPMRCRLPRGRWKRPNGPARWIHWAASRWRR